MLILTTILRKCLFIYFFFIFFFYLFIFFFFFFSKPFEAQGQWSRAKHEENECDVHIVEMLIIFKLHYCLHDLMFQTTFLQNS